MPNLPKSLFNAAAVRELDRVAIHDFNIPGYTLMTRAGTAAFAAMRAHFPGARRIAFVCGQGNNGGDGYVAARLAHLAGLQVHVHRLGELADVKGDAIKAVRDAQEAGVIITPLFAEGLAKVDLVVDALLGTGLDRPVAGHCGEAIAAINKTSCPVLALDIPSGLHADTGGVMGAAVRADVTISFLGLKQGMFTGNGREYSGTVLFDDLAVPEALFQRVIPTAERIRFADFRPHFAPRNRVAHKGHYGHVLVVGGDVGMSGAARLAAEAAARVGAGLVSVATHPDHAAVMNIGRPEIMCRGVVSSQDLQALLQRTTVIALGPGLGKSSWAVGLLDKLVSSALPMVVDADGLNLLASNRHPRGNWILTPHPGEAARLLGISVEEIEANRFAAARALQKQFSAQVVLKGAGTLVCTDENEQIAVCDGGNPGMATAGMGDVLTGVVAGLLAQGFSLADAARIGCTLHAAAADQAAMSGERGLLASDLMPVVRELVNP